MTATAYDMIDMKDLEQILADAGWLTISAIAERYGYSHDQSVFNTLSRLKGTIRTQKLGNMTFVNIQDFEDYHRTRWNPSK